MKKKNEMMCKEQLLYSQHYPDTFSSIDKKTMTLGFFIYSMTSRNEFLLNEIFLIKIERYFCQTKDSKITFGHLL